MSANRKQSRLTGAVSVTTAQAIVLVLGYVTHLWIGRVLGPSPYGIYGVVLNVQTIFGLLLTLGVPIAISRFVAQDDEHAGSILRQALRIQLVFAALVTILVLFLAAPLSRLLGDGNLRPYIMFVAFVVLAQAFYPVFVQFLSGMHHFNKQALLTIIYAVAKVIGALSLLYFFQVYGAFAGFMVGGLVAGAIGWYWTRRLGGTRQKTFPTRAFLSFAGTYVLILVGLQLLISLDLFMVKALLDNDVLAGYYNASSTLARIPYMLLQALGFILLPSVAALTKPGRSHDVAAQFIADTFRYLIALIVPAVALAAVTSKSLVTLFYSSEYIPAAPSFTILILGLGSLAFYLLLSNIVSGAGHPRVSLSITVMLIAISGVAGYLLIPRFGLMGAAWQTTMAGVMGLVILASYTVSAFKIPIPYRSTTNVLIATAVAIFPTFLWPTSPLTLPIHYLLALLLYLATLYLLREFSEQDRRRLASMHRSLKWIAP